MDFALCFSNFSTLNMVCFVFEDPDGLPSLTANQARVWISDLHRIDVSQIIWYSNSLSEIGVWKLEATIEPDRQSEDDVRRYALL